jgi:hypothetical protein
MMYGRMIAIGEPTAMGEDGDVYNTIAGKRLGFRSRPFAVLGLSSLKFLYYLGLLRKILRGIVVITSTLPFVVRYTQPSPHIIRHRMTYAVDTASTELRNLDPPTEPVGSSGRC